MSCAVIVSHFGSAPDGAQVQRYVLSNDRGLTVAVADYGATLLSVRCPDRAGRQAEVTLCPTTFDELLANPYYFGCIVGRVANRIAKGRFALEGKTYELAVNNGPNHLHGGLRGFDKRVWRGTPFVRADRCGVELRLVSDDGEEGYPGRLDVRVVYTVLADSNELVIEKFADPSAPTPVSLANHAYWNLSGDFASGAAGVLDHQLQLHAHRVLGVDGTQIPTGELLAVDETAFDFSASRRIGDRLFEVDGGGRPGYDHCYLVDAGAGDAPAGPGPAQLRPVARLSDPASGRVMEVSSTLPGVQVYTANWVDAEPPFCRHAAVCLETQHLPDAINQPTFPSPVATPEAPFAHATRHRFSVA